MKKAEALALHSELLRTFLVVADCENGTHAANTLGRTQSAISVQIRKLESILSATLFDRQARGMVLTGEGRKLLPAARKIISDLQRLGASFDTPLRGRIKVGIPDDYADAVLENALVEFAGLHPEVEIFTEAGCTAGFETAIERGDLDIAVCSGPTVGIGEALATEPNCWVSSEDYRQNPEVPVALALLQRDCWWRDIPTNALTEAGRGWKLVYSSESFASVKAAIRAGLAVGVLPKSTIEPGMIELGEREGFPALPDSNRAIAISDHAPKDISSAMAVAIRTAISRNS